MAEDRRTFMSGSIVWNGRELAALLRGPSGPVARMQIVNGQVVKAGARARVGVSEVPPLVLGRQFHRRRPGTLRDSIVVRLVQEGGELVCYVGSEDPIAMIHHEGTDPHPIEPRRQGGRLVFYWPRVGRVVTFKRIPIHPGTPPNRYLTDALRDWSLLALR